MAYEGNLKLWGDCVAASDLSSKQFYCVDLDTTAAGSQIALQTTAGGTVFGVLQNKPTAGQAGVVALPGSFTKVSVGSTGFTAGDQVSVDANGQVVTATSSKRIIGRAMMTGVSGDIATIYLEPAAAQS